LSRVNSPALLYTLSHQSHLCTLCKTCTHLVGCGDVVHQVLSTLCVWHCYCARLLLTGRRCTPLWLRHASRMGCNRATFSLRKTRRHWHRSTNVYIRACIHTFGYSCCRLRSLQHMCIYIYICTNLCV
jgi:hypothetical protein